MIDSLKNIYPNSLHKPKKVPNSDEYFHFLCDEDSLYIPLRDLDASQLQLLKIFSQKTIDASPNFLTTHLEESWYQFLVHKHPNMPTGVEHIRMLQFDYYKRPDAFDYAMWRETLTNAIDAVVTVIHLNERRMLVILDSDKLENDAMTQITGLVNTLDDDFELSTRGIIGQIHTVSQALPTLYENEQALFDKALQSEVFNHIQFLSDSLLTYIGHEATLQQPILSNLRQQILTNSEYEATIRTLFERRGNLTQAADALFVHRNTLTYRMNKFTKETGFNLQHLPDLIICYLALN